MVIYLQNVVICFSRGVDALLSQAKDWESRAEYGRAIDIYLKLNKGMTQNHDILEDSWTKVC